jgi:phosphopantothenoylcysteine decarboxylase/phosphopantothenate--cysteine ligase
MVNGNCDNLLIATIYQPNVQFILLLQWIWICINIHQQLASFKKLEQFGNTMIPAESGELASGLSGEGRMAEPENIVAFLEADLESKLPLKGQKILITAGPTYEAIDPVRFIGNHSSGKMGFDIALSAANLGASK